MSVKTVSQTLASAVATSGTFTVTYPDGTNAAWFQKGTAHKIAALGNEYSIPEDFAITAFGNTTCTVTWRHSATLPAGTVVRVGLDAPGGRWLDEPPVYQKPDPNRVTPVEVVRITLGAPVVADVDGIVDEGIGVESGTLTLTGVTVTGGVAILDVPRNVTITSANKTLAGTTFTVTGKDLYNNTIIEAIAGQGTATAMAGVKAFKKITSIVASGTSLTASHQSSASIGFGDVLGLPVFLPNTVNVLKELEDGASATAGTVVAGLSTATVSTSTTADVRGTYDPNSATDGAKAFELIAFLSDPTFRGNPQYDG